ncbi:hypothetical protein JTB14_010772 [Gonioctena quinquepunctata]|nr:hypothetical protein JTB14_010772 [Gonioctena quinquepunctata]
MAKSQAPSSNEELLKKIADYEKLVKQKDVEIDNYKKQVASMEGELAQAQNFKQQRAKENEEINSLKMESEQTLTKAKSIIFERTKVIKNQELQIEAYTQQIQSLKDVVRITKDLLEIRNLEVKQLENKINCLEERMAAEKERQDLMHKKLETMIRHNGELKREYEAQLCLFSALRERYSERELARNVVDDLRGGPSTNETAVVGGVGESGGTSVDSPVIPGNEEKVMEVNEVEGKETQISSSENLQAEKPSEHPEKQSLEMSEKQTSENLEKQNLENPEKQSFESPEKQTSENQEKQSSENLEKQN